MIQPIQRGAVALVLFGVIPLPVTGQSPVALPTYQLPVIALAQPLSGGAVQQDKPVVVFRFAAGEQGDPIDARSFAMSVDGRDRTSLFQMTVAEAWGPLISAAETINLGRHELVARICSARGACSMTTATIAVSAAGLSSDAPASKNQQKKTRILDALLGALRTLLKS